MRSLPAISYAGQGALVDGAASNVFSLPADVGPERS